jgi:hypothetical protein
MKTCNHGLFQGTTIPAFTWREWQKLHKNFVTIAGNSVKIQTGYLPNASITVSGASTFTYFIFHFGEVIHRWLNILKTHFIVDGVDFTTLLFASD